MIALNHKEIRRRSLKFWSLFGLLLLSTLIVLYFFVWSSHRESQAYLDQLQEHRTVVNKQIVLQSKVDSLFALASHLEYGAVANYLFLESYIRDQKRDIQKFIGADSSTRFSGYNAIVRHLDQQLLLRDTIIGLIGRAEDLRSNLEQCKNRNKALGRSLIRGARQ